MSETKTQLSIDSIIANDRKIREPGVATGTTGLLRLSDLSNDETWDYSYPTLMARYWRRNNNKSYLRKTDGDYATNFYKKEPIMQDILSYTEKFGVRICAAGGCVGFYLNSSNDERYSGSQSIDDGDIDLFFYKTDSSVSLSKDDLTSVLDGFINHIIAVMDKKVSDMRRSNIDNITQKCLEEGKKFETLTHYELRKYGLRQIDWDITMVRSKNALTIKINQPELGCRDMKIQVIFRLYDGISELLHGFDIGPSAVAFDGEQVYLTGLSKFCYENSVMILDTTRRSTTYEARIKKYMQRGFSLVMPDLNISSLPTANLSFGLPEVARLKVFPFSYKSVVGNRIDLHNLHGRFTSVSDYGGDITNDDKTLDRNILSLLRNDWEKSWFYYISNEKSSEILYKLPDINHGKIDQKYFHLLRTIVMEGKFDYAKYRKYIRWQSLSKTLEEYFADLQIDDDNIEKLNKYSLFKSLDARRDYLDDVINKQRDICKSRCDAILSRDSHDIEWIMENPGTQTSGSFNPIVEDPIEWYGEEFYLAGNQ